ncbi:uncharacterized protein LOC128864422 [Anastrepha ludens]|uniref:uncharacterized protein LOC128864422 n=1 Tax=Anastrepha ludens TaxID=28586 RepID=UPI0023B16A36|nr:uncharacterized protein LOC128864422 [Anastrepha ludens]
MTQQLFILVLIFLLSAEHLTLASIIRVPRSAENYEFFTTERPDENSLEDSFISSATREQFEREALNETKTFLDTMFRSQIDYFSKVKDYLSPTVKRVADIEKYIERLEKAILADSVRDKDKMWRDTFVEFSDTAFLLNNEKDTGVSNTRYLEILNDSGLEETTKKFLSDVSVYFLKMAKASGKAMGSTIDEQIEKWQNK